MAQEAVTEGAARPRGRKRRILRNAFRVFLVLLIMAILIAWWQRKEIADGLIADTFRDNDIRATYDIDSISPRKQVLSDIVLGDPERPDLTIERLELSISPRFGLPDVTELRLVRPRIYGTLRDDELSFGELDALIFSENEEDGPVELPNIELVIEDGRGLLLTDYGRVGLKVEGGGHLRGGFDARLAAVSRELALGDCALDAPTLYGALHIDAERPRFAGPMRFDALDCADSGLSLADADVQLDLAADRNIADFEGKYAVTLGRSAFAAVSARGLSGEGRFSWRDGDLNALYDLTARGFQSNLASAAELALDGRVRAVEQFARVEVDGDIAGNNLRMGADLDGAIASAAEAGRGTLAEPLLGKLGLNLARELRGSAFTANFDARMIGERTSVVVPEARLRGGSGATVVALSRGQLAMGGGGLPRFSGNLATGGEGLPRITGRMEQSSNGALELRLAMRQYASGNSRLSVPRMSIMQGRDGRIALDGQVLASGPLPGGFAQGLVLPVDGTIAADGSLALWSGCRDVRFERLAVSSLTLDRQSLRLCPPSGRPILRYGSGGLQLAAGATSLDLRGRLAETPIRLRSGAVGFAYPGAVAARDLDIALGPAGSAQRFTISNLRADMTASGIGGDFSGADVFLASVPLDVLGASGNWRYADDRLSLTGTNFTLEDRQADARFEPLVAEGATLTLFDNVITADTLLRHPGSGRTIAQVDIRHDLGNGTGSADLDLGGVTFEQGFQPTDLTRLALGVVANVRGRVTGEGRIDWNSGGVTSTGSFSSDSLDLAATFGPVTGASGTVVFTDLLGLTTAPDQRIRVASVNPGIEVTEGEISFQLVRGETIAIAGGRWPFMGGTLALDPVDINIGVAEARTYELVVTGLEASRFIERMDIGNLAATGTFDGRIPIVFDADGNGQLVGGFLTSRPPGGSLSYVGELTYEDMGFFANYAFRTLRDLEYETMNIRLNGPLTGELVTQVRFTGISQGPAAERNIVSRIIDDIPIDLRINIRAPFYKLINSIRSIYDPAALRDPRDLGLVSDDGVRLRETVDERTVEELDERAAEQAQCELLGGPACENVEQPDIQPEESEPAP